MRTVYFDNSATTRVSEASAAGIMKALENWGNPSSAHEKGTGAEKLIEESRNNIIKALGIRNPRSGRLIFTGSGTEADNLAVSGTVYCRKYRFKPRIIITDSEHPAVENTVREAEMRGFDVVRLSTRGGVIDFDELGSALTPETVLVSVMRVNNETGAVYDVGKIFSMAKERCPDVIIHCDAVQGFLKTNCSPSRLHADLVTVSGHKIGGPKGIGALWCDENLIFHKRIRPVIFGGGQEQGFRSGTENVPCIVGMGEAAKERFLAFEDDRIKVSEVRSRLLSLLPEGVLLNSTEGEYIPNIVSLYVPGIKSEVIVRFMSSKGIYISAGSACSSKRLKTSRVLTAFGLTPDRADSTVRVSFSHENTPDEADIFAGALSEAMKTLVGKY